jgi:hypothetical protein
MIRSSSPLTVRYLILDPLSLVIESFLLFHLSNFFFPLPLMLLIPFSSLIIDPFSSSTNVNSTLFHLQLIFFALCYLLLSHRPLMLLNPLDDINSNVRDTAKQRYQISIIKFI